MQNGRSIVRRAVLLIAAVVALAYVGAVVWLASQETTLVFRAGRPLGEARPSVPYEQVELPRADGARQFAWVMTHHRAGDEPPWLLYFHGNAATIASRGNIARYERLHAMGLNVLAPEYRGFGGLEGVPSEAALGSDARAAHDYLRTHYNVPSERIILYGWSLGAAVAVDLASQVQPAAAILEGAPASLVAIGQRQYPYFPIRLIMRNPFDAITKVRRIRTPLLFIHSPEDTVVPMEDGRRLFDAATSSKTFIEVRGGHLYANEVDEAVFYGAIERFLQDLRLLPEAVPGG